ncbi:hypothetical protein PPYR_03696 [Photinus pyralis]|uniref:Protein sleepless n=1 Tax=Photinus pyralis TaxID=7054 RepID=A0A5N4A3K5_PHOPY|nr:uncharacterized protein LOC116162088 [Photinus pyralis]KAB0791896.1 hypothetical protein PPYR_03696 [Photinus pyralis]
MYFKLVLVSVGLICVGVASGGSTRYCHDCVGRTDTSPKDFSNCRNYVNVTKNDDCSSQAYCISKLGTETRNKVTVEIAVRMCSDRNCEWQRKYNAGEKYCSECQSDYCNNDKF